MAAEQPPKDAIALLKQDHREVLDMFEQFENAKDDKKKQELAKTICLELTIHTMLEEEIFYPTFRGKIDDDMIDEAYVEHDSAKVMISEIDAGSPGDDFYDAKVKVLGEEIEHHVKEEEKPGEGIFYEARQTDVDLVKMGEDMFRRKEELKAQFSRDGLPTPEVRTFAGQPELEIGEELDEPTVPPKEEGEGARR